MPPEVRPATHDDVEVLARVLGRAFADDPIWLWVFPGAGRDRRLAHMFGALLRGTLDRGATVLTDADRRAAAIWQRADDRQLGPAGDLRMAAAMVRGRARMVRAAVLVRTVERHHPSPPHWYLAVLGTDPAHQGTGVGTALVRAVLDDPANLGEAAYLETETIGNVAFYRRFGFEVVEEVDVPRGGPHLWFMWRPPP